MVRVDPKEVRHRREELGLNQTELAARAEISPSYASMIERGERTSISPAIAFRLAQVFGIGVDDLRRVGPRLVRPR